MNGLALNVQLLDRVYMPHFLASPPVQANSAWLPGQNLVATFMSLHVLHCSSIPGLAVHHIAGLPYPCGKYNLHGGWVSHLECSQVRAAGSGEDTSMRALVLLQCCFSDREEEMCFGQYLFLFKGSAHLPFFCLCCGPFFVYLV